MIDIELLSKQTQPKWTQRYKNFGNGDTAKRISWSCAIKERRQSETHILEILELRHQTYSVPHLATERRALRILLSAVPMSVWAQPLVFFTHPMAAHRMPIRITRKKALTC